MGLNRALSILIIAGLMPFCGPRLSATAVFFEDFKDSAANFGAHYFQQGSGTATVTTGTELLEIVATQCEAWSSYAIEYPETGTISWDTAQNRYIQFWVPYNGDSDQPTIQVQIDGADWTTTWPDMAGLLDQAMNTRPVPLDLNASYNLSAGVHTLKFRFIVYTTPYAWIDADQYIIEGTFDWVRAGMAPSANTTVGACAFVGPADAALTDNPPTLQWDPPAGFSGSYSVSYSKDRFFRGPTTVTVHGVATNSYTPSSELAEGQWYWTVIPVNNDEIAGYVMPKDIDVNGISGGDWRAPYDYLYYSFLIPGVNSVKQWAVFE